jgi:heme a synthase
VIAVRRTALVALVLAYVHTVFGAVVRISGSAMGCGDHWPDCNGSLLPSLTNRTLVIELTHRYSAVALLGVPTLALVLVAIAHWRTPGIRGRNGVLRAALLAAALVIMAALVGMALVVRGLTGGPAVALHYVIALATLAALTRATQRAGGMGASGVESDGLAPAKTYRGALAAAILVLITVVFGSLTANIPGAAQSCQGFPWCREGIVSTGSVLFVQLAHRVLAFLVALHLLGFTIGSARRLAAKPIIRAAQLALLIVVLQLGAAAALVELHLPPVLQSLHQALGTLLWVSTVSLAGLAKRAMAVQTAPAALSDRSAVETAGAVA